MLTQEKKRIARDFIQNVHYKLFSMKFRQRNPSLNDSDVVVIEEKDGEEKENDSANGNANMNTSDDYFDQIIREKCQNVSLDKENSGVAVVNNDPEDDFGESWAKSVAQLNKQVEKFEKDFKNGREEKIFEVWEKNREEYTLLYEVAINILSAPTSEHFHLFRLFSIACEQTPKMICSRL